jgi:leucyl aminopeptidase
MRWPRARPRCNVIGAIGLVENMPDGNAQRPGDIVTSLSGQTIEIINTDAEGRLVLADVLWYVQDRFKPKFMVNLATLTGAILVALGQEYAGLFSNNDELAQRLFDCGKLTGEKVWRLPMGPEYDKIIDSKFADVKNSGGRFGGSITAAQFLQRFVNDTPWAHLDIAGTGMGSPQFRHQPLLGLGLGRAPARPAGEGARIRACCGSAARHLCRALGLQRGLSAAPRVRASPPAAGRCQNRVCRG